MPRLMTCLLIVLAAVGGSAAAAPDARSILDQSNAAYAALFDTPRRVVLTAHAVTRSPGVPDLVIESRSIVLQHRDHVRFETRPGWMLVASGGETRDGGSLTWVLDGQVLRSRYVGPFSGSGAPEVSEFMVDHARIPVTMGRRFHDPMMAPEFPVEFMDAEWSVATAVMHGRPFLRLRSKAAIPLSPVASMEVVLWIDASTRLVNRMESTAHQDDPDAGVRAHIAQVMDIAYELDVPIADDAFDLTLGAASRDLTDITIERLQQKLDWRAGREAN